jgi:hypothetical protein
MLDTKWKNCCVCEKENPTHVHRKDIDDKRRVYKVHEECGKELLEKLEEGQDLKYMEFYN